MSKERLPKTRKARSSCRRDIPTRAISVHKRVSTSTPTFSPYSSSCGAKSLCSSISAARSHQSRLQACHCPSLRRHIVSSPLLWIPEGGEKTSSARRRGRGKSWWSERVAMPPRAERAVFPSRRQWPLVGFKLLGSRCEMSWRRCRLYMHQLCLCEY